MDSTIISKTEDDALLALAAAQRYPSLTTTIDDVYDGVLVKVVFTITDLGGGNIRVDVAGDGTTDISAIYFDFAATQEGFLKDGLKVEDTSGNITAWKAGDDSIKTIGDSSSTTVNGAVAKLAEGGFDLGLATGLNGATTYVTQTSFILSSPSLSLKSFEGAVLAVRGMSTLDPTTGELTASSKIGEQLSSNFFDARDDALTVYEDSTDSINVFANDVNAAGAVVTQWYLPDGTALKGDTYTDTATKTVFTFKSDGTIAVNAMDADILTSQDAILFNFSYDAQVTDTKDETTFLKDSANVQITVIGLDNDNTAPMLRDIYTEAFGEGRVAKIDLHNFVTDTAGDTHTFSLMGAPQYSVVKYVPGGSWEPVAIDIDTSGILTLDPATGMLTLNADSSAIAVLHEGWTLTLTGTYRATDAGGLSDDASYTFFIAGKSSLAVKEASVAINEGASASIDLIKEGYITNLDYQAITRVQQRGAVTFQYVDPEDVTWPQPPFDTSGISVVLLSGGRLEISAANLQALPAGARLFAVLNYDAKVMGTTTSVPGTVKIEITGLSHLDVSAQDLRIEGYGPVAGQVTITDHDFGSNATLTSATATLANGKTIALDLYGETKISDGIWLSLFGDSYAMIVGEEAASLKAGEEMAIQLSFTATGSYGKEATANVTATVVGVNDELVFSPVSAVVDEYGSAAVSLSRLIFDPDKEAVTVSLDGIQAGRIYDAAGAYMGNLDQNTLQQLLITIEQQVKNGLTENVLTVDTAKYGAFNFLSEGMTIEVDARLSAKDASGTPSQGLATINILGANDAAVVRGNSIRIDGYGHAEKTLMISDPDLFGKAIVIDATAQLATGETFSLDFAGAKTEVSSGVFASFDVRTNTYALEVTDAADALLAGEELRVRFVFTVADNYGALTTASVMATAVGVNDAPKFTGSIDLTAEEDGGAAAFLYGTLDGELYSPYITEKEGESLSLSLLGISEGKVYDANGDPLMTLTAEEMQGIATLERRDESAGTGDWLVIADPGKFNFLSEGTYIEAIASLRATDASGNFQDGEARIVFTGRNDAVESFGNDIQLRGYGVATGILRFKDPDAFDGPAYGIVTAATATLAGATFDLGLYGERTEVSPGIFVWFDAGNNTYGLEATRAPGALPAGEELSVQLSFTVSDSADPALSTTSTVSATAIGVAGTPEFIREIAMGTSENSYGKMLLHGTRDGELYSPYIFDEDSSLSLALRSVSGGAVYDANGRWVMSIGQETMKDMIALEYGVDRVSAGYWLTVADRDYFNFLSQGMRVEASASLSATDPDGLTGYGTARITFMGRNDAATVAGEDISLTGDGTATGRLTISDTDLFDDPVRNAVSLITGSFADGTAFDYDPFAGGEQMIREGIYFSFDSADNSYTLRVDEAAAGLGSNEEVPVSLTFFITDLTDAAATSSVTVTATAIGGAGNNAAPRFSGVIEQTWEEGSGLRLLLDMQPDGTGYIMDPESDAFSAKVEGIMSADLYDADGNLIEVLDPATLGSLLRIEQGGYDGTFGNWLIADATGLVPGGARLELIAALSATDAFGATAYEEARLSLLGSNDAPLISGATDLTITGYSQKTGQLKLADPDLYDSARLTGATATLPDGRAVELVSGALTEVAAGIFVLFNSSNNTYQLRTTSSAAQHLEPGEAFPILMTFTAVDNAGAETVAAVTLTAIGVANTAPAWQAFSLTADENSTTSISLSKYVRDLEGNSFNVELVSVSEWMVSLGDILGADGTNTIVFSPEETEGLVTVNSAKVLTIDALNSGIFNFMAPGMTATATVRLSATDSLGATSYRNVPVTIQGANDAPMIFSDIYDGGNTSLSGAGTIAGSLFATDPDLGDFAVLFEASAMLADGTTYFLDFFNGIETEIMPGVFVSYNYWSESEGSFSLRVDEGATGEETAITMAFSAVDAYEEQIRTEFNITLFSSDTGFAG